MNEKLSAYEVLRIINSKPLFWEDHYLRMNKTVLNICGQNVNQNSFKNALKQKIQSENIVNGNLKIVLKIINNIPNGNPEVFVIPHRYPTTDEYRCGVKTLSFSYERENPENKIWKQDIRDVVDSLIKEKNVYEVLYLDRNNCFTEGSRSNLFFLKENKLYSAPENKILHGVTRKYIIKIANATGIEVIHKDIQSGEIAKFDSAFISGTSPKILPLSFIDDIEFNVENATLRKLMSEFDLLLDNYLKNLVF
jgi:branched-chain amino acid aminotransferase